MNAFASNWSDFLFCNFSGLFPKICESKNRIVLLLFVLVVAVVLVAASASAFDFDFLGGV